MHIIRDLVATSVLTPLSALLVNQGRNGMVLCIGMTETESHQEKMGGLKEEEKNLFMSSLLISLLSKLL